MVSVFRDKPGADQRLLPRRSGLPRLVALAFIVLTQLWSAGGTSYWGYCLGVTVALVTVACAVTAAKVLTARRALRRLPAE
jgi:hypothetical protein